MSIGLFPGASVVKTPPANVEDAGSIPGSGRPPGGGNGNPLQYSYLENPMDREAWKATVYGAAKSQTWLSDKVDWKVKVKVAQLYPTLCDPMDYTIHGILQARILEWVAFPFSRGSSQPRDQNQVSRIAGGFFTSWATREAQEYWSG